MRDLFEVTVNSITTAKEQHLYLDGADAEMMKGKRILIVDDVISTGESLTALEALVEKAGGIIAGLGNGNIVMVGIGVAIKCLGSAPACYLILAMLADVIDHIEYKSNMRTDGLTMSIYSIICVAATPVCNAIFSALLGVSGYDQFADVALGTAGQAAAVQGAISISYIWIETVAYIICAGLIFLFTVEKDLPQEQAAIAARKREQS
jgi:GPH family glycoside/pentoside/hexuronide:cation symporter